MPPAYSSEQKRAIQQFQQVTSADRSAAVKYLKSHEWNQQAAINGYFSAPPSGSSQSSLAKLFDKYREDPLGEPDHVGVDGTMKYLADIGVDIEGLESLAALEIVQAPLMGEMEREGFQKGWSAHTCDTLDKQKSYVKNLKETLPRNKEAFTKVYNYTFQLAKTAGQKAVPLDTASAYWELLFTSPLSAVKWKSDTSPWTAWWIEFLNSQWKRSINKDVWNQTLKFALLTLEDEAMGFWSEEASWPSVIDEFVDWVKKEKRAGTVDSMEE